MIPPPVLDEDEPPKPIVIQVKANGDVLFDGELVTDEELQYRLRKLRGEAMDA